jgi:hypothetical protein
MADLWESLAAAILCDGGWGALMATYGKMYKPFVKFACEHIYSIDNELN